MSTNQPDQISLAIILEAILTQLKEYKDRGDLQQWIVHANGTSLAVYAQGTVSFDINGNCKRKAETTEVPS